jgi:hypothetical protein
MNRARNIHVQNCDTCTNPKCPVEEAFRGSITRTNKTCKYWKRLIIECVGCASWEGV